MIPSSPPFIICPEIMHGSSGCFTRCRILSRISAFCIRLHGGHKYKMRCHKVISAKTIIIPSLVSYFLSWQSGHNVSNHSGFTNKFWYIELITASQFPINFLWCTSTENSFPFAFDCFFPHPWQVYLSRFSAACLSRDLSHRRRRALRICDLGV